MANIGKAIYNAAAAITLVLALAPLAAGQSVSPTLAGSLDVACVKLGSLNGVANFADQIADFCSHGKGAPQALKTLAKPFLGSGDIRDYVHPVLHSENGETEVSTLDALRFPLTLAQVQQAHDRSLSFGMDEGDVKSRLELIAKLPQTDPNYTACYRIKQTMTTTIALIDFETVMVQKQCIATLSQKPAIAMVFIQLDPSAENPDNRLMNHASLLIEDGGTTYNLTSMHMFSSNRHFPSIVESLAQDSVPLVTKTYFQTIMKAAASH